MMSDKKKLLILGGSANQLRLVEAAKKAGIYTVVCNWSDDCARPTAPPARPVTSSIPRITWIGNR